MDAVADLLLAEAEHYAAGHTDILTPLHALRVRLASADCDTAQPQWEHVEAVYLIAGDKVVVGGVERELIAAERGLRDGWVLLGWSARDEADPSSVWLADSTRVWRHLWSPMDERDTMNMRTFR